MNVTLDCGTIEVKVGERFTIRGETILNGKPTWILEGRLFFPEDAFTLASEGTARPTPLENAPNVYVSQETTYTLEALAEGTYTVNYIKSPADATEFGPIVNQYYTVHVTSTGS